MWRFVLNHDMHRAGNSYRATVRVSVIDERPLKHFITMFREDDQGECIHQQALAYCERYGLRVDPLPADLCVRITSPMNGPTPDDEDSLNDLYHPDYGSEVGDALPTDADLASLDSQPDDSGRDGERAHDDEPDSGVIRLGTDGCPNV